MDCWIGCFLVEVFYCKFVCGWIVYMVDFVGDFIVIEIVWVC